MAELPHRTIIHPELPDDPRGMMATGQNKRALARYAREYAQSLKESDLYIASVTFEAMYQATLSLLSEQREEPVGRRFHAELASVLRDAVVEASEGQYDREDFQTNLEVCELKYRPKRQRKRRGGA